MATRGVMIPPLDIWTNAGKTSVAFVGGERLAARVPQALLYWDKISAPVAGMGFRSDWDDEVDALVGLGVCETDAINVTGNYGTPQLPVMLGRFANIFKNLDERKEEIWSVLPAVRRPENTLSSFTQHYLPRSDKPVESIEVRVMGSLPFPTRAIPYADILEFKSRRRDQLERLHREVSAISSRYAANYDDSKAFALSLADVEEAVSDLRRVYEEKWPIRFLGNLSVAFLLEGMIPVSANHLFAGADLDKAVAVGATYAVLRTAIASTLDKKHKDSPFAYSLDAEAL